MTAKRFKLIEYLPNVIRIEDMGKKLKGQEIVDLLNRLFDENEQLKQDRNALIHLLENQSMIIEELHSTLLAYQVKEPIVLTKEDLNLMGKAIGYYTHGRYAE